MDNPAPSELSRLLAEWNDGNPEVESKVFALVYSQLHSLAARYLRQERPDHTLQTTALIHEVYVRLTGQQEMSWKDPSHFFAVAAKSMRRVLVDYARTHNARKRGGGLQKTILLEPLVASEEQTGIMMALDEALDRLEKLDLRQSKIVELRYFGGFTNPEIAQMLGISSRTIAREWDIARAWLHSEISK